MAPGETIPEPQVANATTGEPGVQSAPKPFNLAEFIKNGKKIRQERIRRVAEKYKKLRLKAHHGTVTRVAMNRPLTPTQFYRLQSQLPAQIAYALTDAREMLQEKEIAQAEASAT